MTAAEAWWEVRWSETPTWQLVTLPAVPVYCRDTHAEAVPSFRNPVSSKTSASGSIAASIRQASWARMRAGFQGLVVMKLASA
ncbi:hypothetical protein GCM10020295_67620 [Streptomyces cinereospinus]